MDVNLKNEASAQARLQKFLHRTEREMKSRPLIMNIDGRASLVPETVGDESLQIQDTTNSHQYDVPPVNPRLCQSAGCILEQQKNTSTDGLSSCPSNIHHSQIEEEEGSEKEDQEEEEDERPPKQMSTRISFFKYIQSEISHDYLLEKNKETFTAKRKRVYTFMKIPRELEKLIFFGFLQCADAFLYMFTFLPLRVLFAVIHLFLSLFHGGPGRWLQSSEMCDFLKLALFIICIYVMEYIDVSVFYHMVRGQAVIKLYIFFNMLEIADKLFSSFGQDILDALFWTALEPAGRKRERVDIIPHFALAVVYVSFHAMLVLLQATTLNVAFNSHSKSLLTIMMSNNFVEIKGSVFKRFEKNNLFQMSCADIRERFHYIVLLFIVLFRNMTEFSWNSEHFWVLIPDMIFVLLAEFIVDWLKHAFITKFNEIPAEVYGEFKTSLAYDMTTSRQKSSFTDNSDLMSRRMGFIPFPLSVLVVRIVSQTVKVNSCIDIVLLVLGYLCLLSLKILINIFLLGWSKEIVVEHKASQEKSAAQQSEAAMRNHMVRKTQSAMNFRETDRYAGRGTRFVQSVKTVNSNVNINNACLNEDMLSAESHPKPMESFRIGNGNKSDYSGFTRKRSPLVSAVPN